MHLLASSGPLSLSPDRLPPWSHFVTAYLDDYTAHVAAYRPAAAERTSIELELAWLESLRGVEQDSYRRAVDAGVFEGVRVEDLQRVAEKEIVGKGLVRDGLEALVEGVRRWNRAVRVDGNANESLRESTRVDVNAYDDLDVKVDVISVNWSATFIKQVIYSAIPESLAREIRVFANELPGLVTSSSSGSISGTSTTTPERNQNQKEIETLPTCIRTARDKAAFLRYAVSTRTSRDTNPNMSVLESLDTNTDADMTTNTDRNQHQSQSQNQNQNQSRSENENEDEKAMVVYIGDSATDLECLVAADVGVCIRDAPMGGSQRELAETCERVGVEVQDLRRLTHGEMVIEKERGGRRLWWVDGLERVREVLVGCGGGRLQC